MTFYNPVTNQPTSVFRVMKKDIDTPVQICLLLLLGTQTLDRDIEMFLTTESTPTGILLRISPSGSLMSIINLCVTSLQVVGCKCYFNYFCRKFTE